MVFCPYLPEPERILTARSIREAGNDRGPQFYFLALACAQSLWLRGLPAQSILLLNRAFSSDLSGDEPELEEWPLPYQAMRWVMENRAEDQFIGNPRRHFQHLATRMVEPRRELRSWRAWACWYLACRCFPDFPADEKQLAEESIHEPTREEIYERLGSVGLSGEAELWEKVAIPPFRG